MLDGLKELVIPIVEHILKELLLDSAVTSEEASDGNQDRFFKHFVS
jgi:hypothetical protein